MSDVSKNAEVSPGLPPGYTEVGQGHWESVQMIGHWESGEMIEGDSPLATLAVSSCAVVVVRNVETARGYLGHFSQPHSDFEGDKEAFDEMIGAIVREREDPVHMLEAWVSGTSPAGEKGEEHKVHDAEVMASRSYILQELAKLGAGTEIKTRWLGEMQQLALVTFDPLRGPEIQYAVQAIEPAPAAK